MMNEDIEKFVLKVKEMQAPISAELKARQDERDAIPEEERQRNREVERRERFFNMYRKDGKPHFYPSFIVFADLLGIRNWIRSSEDDEEMLSTIASALETAAPMLEEGVWSYFRYYSDCVSLITPVTFDDDESHESEFGEIVTGLGCWQAMMVIQGVPVRGGLAFGNMYVDERSLFGKPHVTAYDIEQEVAVVPRICLCPASVELLGKQMEYYAVGYESPQERDVLLDVDGHAFVNYLNACHGYFHERETELLEPHRNLIEGRLSSNESRVREKYLWMRDYHNWICDDWSKKYGDFSAFKLGESLRGFRNLRQWLNGDAE
jgi:hypothetical protein